MKIIHFVYECRFSLCVQEKDVTLPYLIKTEIIMAEETRKYTLGGYMIETYCDTILVVDDNQAILTTLKICLAGAFRRVLTLESPDNLVATLKKEDVDVVLLDMNFSLGVNTGQDGLFWLRTLKKLYPDTPVVLMTAYADVQLAVKGLKNGAADFVTKPWDNDELIRTLRDAVEKNRVVVPLDKLEQQHVHRVVEQCHGNMSRAAELLGITRQTLYRKLKTDN